MNILYLTNHLNIGGISSYVLSLAAGMKRKGHNVYIASSGGQLLFRFIQEGIVYFPIPIKTKSEASPKVFISLFKLLKIIKEKNIDLIHANTRVTGVLGCLMHKFSGKPYLLTCHGFFKRRLSRKLFPCWGLKVIAISQAVKEHLIEDFKVKAEDIKVIHNGIDVEKSKIPALPAGRKNQKSKIDVKKDLGLNDGPVIGIVARLSDVKGHIYLIEAMKLVLAKIPDAQLLIVGEGRMKEELVKLSKRLGIEKNVNFVSSVMDTIEVLSIMDLFVMPSLKEGLGLSLMEAMAAGRAVVASEVGGIKSLIRDGYNGLLVKPADSQGLSFAILDLLEDPKKRESFGENARIFIRDNFSQEKMVQDTEKLYLECLNLKS